MACLMARSVHCGKWGIVVQWRRGAKSDVGSFTPGVPGSWTIVRVVKNGQWTRKHNAVRLVLCLKAECFGTAVQTEWVLACGVSKPTHNVNEQRRYMWEKYIFRNIIGTRCLRIPERFLSIHCCRYASTILCNFRFGENVRNVCLYDASFLPMICISKFSSTHIVNDCSFSSFSIIVRIWHASPLFTWCSEKSVPSKTTFR